MDNGTRRSGFEVFFAGAGMDGEKRYELHGLTAEIGDLTLAQLHEALRAQGEISEETIGQYRQQISDLATQPAGQRNRPSVLIPTKGSD